jgi:ATP-dependent exoDNAse (exonuclease V) beta subunit
VKITLEPKTHTYTDAGGAKYKSVSALIEQFVPFFDFEQKSYDYSVKYGLPVEEVRSNWREKNKKSTVFGHKIHSNIEKLISENKTEHTEGIYDQILKEISKFYTKGAELLTEQIIHSDKYKVAGTSDLIVQRKSDFDIVDFKTNKKIKIENPFNEFLLYPVQHLQNSEYFKYALQLSLYALMNEKLTNKKVYRLVMFWFKRKNPEDYESLDGTWVRYPIPYLKEEAELVLEYGAGK